MDLGHRVRNRYEEHTKCMSMVGSLYKIGWEQGKAFLKTSSSSSSAGLSQRTLTEDSRRGLSLELSLNTLVNTLGSTLVNTLVNALVSTGVSTLVNTLVNTLANTLVKTLDNTLVHTLVNALVSAHVNTLVSPSPPPPNLLITRRVVL